MHVAAIEGGIGLRALVAVDVPIHAHDANRHGAVGPARQVILVGLKKLRRWHRTVRDPRMAFCAVGVAIDWSGRPSAWPLWFLEGWNKSVWVCVCECMSIAISAQAVWAQLVDSPRLAWDRTMFSSRASVRARSGRPHATMACLSISSVGLAVAVLLIVASASGGPKIARPSLAGPVAARLSGVAIVEPDEGLLLRIGVLHRRARRSAIASPC